MPQLRDTADDIILNRDMDHPAQVENEQAFLRMQEGPNPNPNPNSNLNLGRSHAAADHLGRAEVGLL